MNKKRFHLSTFFISLVFAFSAPVALANGTTELVTYDLCSKLDEAIFSKKQIGLKITLGGLVPNHPVFMEISLSPANHSANPSDKHVSKKHTETVAIGDTDTVTLKRKIKLHNIEKHRFEIDLSQTWNIQLTWIQPSTLHSGTGLKTLQFVERKVKRLYTITGPMTCIWETPTDLDSQLYINTDQDRMVISRDTSIHPGLSAFRGLDGVYQDHYRLQCPYLIVPGEISPWGFFGWFFLARQKIILIDTVKKMSQKWTLSRGESGVLGQRLTFQRFPAAEYKKTSIHGCSHWEVANRGLLDIGATSNEFILIPHDTSEELKSHPSKIIQFLEDKRPKLNTCDPSLLSETQIQTRSSVGTEGLVYFYPEISEL